MRLQTAPRIPVTLRQRTTPRKARLWDLPVLFSRGHSNGPGAACCETGTESSLAERGGKASDFTATQHLSHTAATETDLLGNVQWQMTNLQAPAVCGKSTLIFFYV